ncbi:MAG: NAD-dependent epimerase/dehydratase family protein [Candidatus Omnitrophica bacterium]|nr:NAD-dependent epimerase/dehydratase family protein [Candidatus Omnitrophota bacterium]
MKTLLITGGTGFLGSHLVKRLTGAYKVVLLKRSFSKTGRLGDILNHVQWYNLDEIDLAEIFSKNTFDVILHTATNYGREADSLPQVLETNLLFPLKLLENGMRVHVPLFINTDTVLGKYTTPYSLSKKQFLEWLAYYNQEIKIINVKLEHFYGPMDDEHNFVTRAIRKLLRNEDLDLTPCDQKRDFIYISDVVNAYAAILEHASQIQQPFMEFEVGTGVSLPLKDLLFRMRTLCGSTSRLNFGALPYRKNEMMDSLVNISTLAQYHWSPRVSLEEGLCQTIQYEKEVLCQTPGKSDI